MYFNKLVGKPLLSAKLERNFLVNIYSIELRSCYRRVREQFIKFVSFEVSQIIQHLTWITLISEEYRKD